MTSKLCAAAVFALLTVTAPAHAATIDFTATPYAFSTTPLVGTSIAGSIVFDPNSLILQQPAGPTSASYSFSAPATFTLTTNGGFSATQNLTGFNVGDAAAGEYYVFDADVGTYGITPFSRLELGFANNPPYTGKISTLALPTTINVADFEFKTVLDYAISPAPKYTVNQILVGSVDSVAVSATPLPPALPCPCSAAPS